ncbi:LysE family translocator [Massilia sp. W12]|uniref:LysE family translocator n=1 Tax=Massilia sp. W12 TaxID=3126507 RepID=UPI0030D01FCE
MPTIETMLQVALAGLLLSASPGPSMAYVLSRSAQYGHSAGLMSSLGLAVGGIGHALLAACGLALLAAQAPWLMLGMKYLGALYLLYLGQDAIRAAFQSGAASAPDVDAPGAPAPHPGLLRLFGQGVLIEISNPKTVLFFLSFITPYAAKHSMGGMFVLSSLIPLTAIPADLLAIFAGGLIAAWATRHGWLLRAVNLAAGLMLCAIAAVLAFA